MSVGRRRTGDRTVSRGVRLFHAARLGLARAVTAAGTWPAREAHGYRGARASRTDRCHPASPLV